MDDKDVKWIIRTMDTMSQDIVTLKNEFRDFQQEMRKDSIEQKLIANTLKVKFGVAMVILSVATSYIKDYFFKGA